MRVEAQPFVAQQHSGPESRSVVVQGQLPDHPPATTLVVDLLDTHASERSNCAELLGAVSGPRERTNTALKALGLRDDHTEADPGALKAAFEDESCPGSALRG